MTIVNTGTLLDVYLLKYILKLKIQSRFKNVVKGSTDGPLASGYLQKLMSFMTSCVAQTAIFDEIDVVYLLQ